MTITKTYDFNDYTPWSGAIDTYDRICNNGKLGMLESILEDIYPDGMNETELNDLLWFEEDTVYDWLGLPTESSINQQIEDLQYQLDDIMSDYEYDIEGKSENEIKEIYNTMYKEDIESIKQEIAELQEELELL
jgi:uncharacterized protein YwgA